MGAIKGLHLLHAALWVDADEASGSVAVEEVGEGGPPSIVVCEDDLDFCVLVVEVGGRGGGRGGGEGKGLEQVFDAEGGISASASGCHGDAVVCRWVGLWFG